jgi:hypothetical protein
LPLLRRLADTLSAAAAFAMICRTEMAARERDRGGPVTFLNEPPSPKSKVIPVEIARRFAERRPAEASAFTIAPDLLDDALTLLAASRYVRRAARAVPGLRTGAEMCACEWVASRSLAEILAMPEDETILAIDPAGRAGLRVLVRGVATVAEFHLLLADVWPDGPRPPADCLAATRLFATDDPPIATARWQLHHPRAMTADGRLPASFAGSVDWIWNDRPLTAIPFVAGERTILLGEPVYRKQWEVVRTLPFPAEPLRVVERWDEATVSRWLNLAGASRAMAA